MINLFPDMPLEVRAYLLLGLIGGIFFIAIIILAVGNVRSTLRRAKEYETTDLHMTQEKKEKKPKKEKVKKEKPKKEKKPLFGKKKDAAVDMLAVPAGYEPEEEEEGEEEEIIFAPTGAGEVIDDDLPDDWLTSPSEPQEQYRSPFDSAPSGGTQFDEANGDEEEEEDYTSDSEDFTTTSESEQKKRSRGNDSSPFGGGVGLDI